MLPMFWVFQPTTLVSLALSLSSVLVWIIYIRRYHERERNLNPRSNSLFMVDGKKVRCADCRFLRTRTSQYSNKLIYRCKCTETPMRGRSIHHAIDEPEFCSRFEPKDN
jgi:hypothetical protein